MNTAIWIAVSGVVIAALTLIYAALKDARQNAREDGKTAEILRGVDEKLAGIKEQSSRSEARLEALAERMAAVEQSAKQAHHRIDELRGMKCTLGKRA